MDASTEFGFRVPYHPEVTEKDMRAAAELWSDHEQSAARQRQKQIADFAATLERSREELRGLLGDENYFAVHQFKQDLRLEAMKKQQPPHGLGMSQAELTRVQSERVADFLAERGLQAEAVRVAVARLFEDLALPSFTEWATVIHLKDFADMMNPPPAPPQNPWVTFTPPFSGWQSGLTHGAVSGFRTGRSELLNPAAGHVGNIVTLDDDDASDLDVGSVVADTQVAFWYQAPVAGLVEVTIAALCGEGRHELRVEDEWGVSDASTTQQNFLMMHVIHPNVRQPAFHLASEFHHEGDNSTYRNEQHINPGQGVEATLLTSDGPVAAGEWMVIRAGCRSQDGSITNDMEIHSRSTFSWFLQRIHVHIRQ